MCIAKWNNNSPGNQGVPFPLLSTTIFGGPIFSSREVVSRWFPWVPQRLLGDHSLWRGVAIEESAQALHVLKLRLMEDIQLRLVVYPMIYRVWTPSKVVHFHSEIHQGWWLMMIIPWDNEGFNPSHVSQITLQEQLFAMENHHVQ